MFPLTMYALPFLVTWLILMFMFLLSLYVGYARVKYNVRAPATVGNPDFERAFRLQANTVENVVLYLPMLWIYTILVSPFWASLVGFVWLAGRIVYAFGYSRAPQLRHMAAPLYFPSGLILIAGAAYGIAKLFVA